MANNKKLKLAKEIKNDEFYTEYQTISNEMGHYRDKFKNKVIYCNCDDPSWSNFWIYFHSNFASLGLKKLISTHYQKDSEPSFKIEYSGGDDFNIDAGKVSEINGNTVIKDKNEIYYSAGDFRSNDCIKLLEETDIVITNVSRIEADDEKNTPEKGIVKGCVFDFRGAILPVEFTVLIPYPPSGLRYVSAFP